MFVRVQQLWDEGRRLELEALTKRKMNCVCGELRLERQKSNYLSVASIMNATDTSTDGELNRPRWANKKGTLAEASVPFFYEIKSISKTLRTQ